MARGRSLSNQQPSYYGGPLTVGATENESNAFNARTAYNNSVFGGANAPQFGDLTTTLSNQMNGQTGLAGMAGSVSPFSTQALTQGFGPTSSAGIAGLAAPGQTNAASQIGNYGFGTTLNAGGRSPTFGVAGNLDARGAYQQMLSGQPDYSNTQSMIDSANAPILRQFNEQILPSLNQRATFTNNETGAIKGLNRVLPEMGQRMGENAQNIMNAERLRALDAQERAASAVSQGGFQGYGLGLQTAQGERGLEQSLAGMGLSADQARAGLQLQDFNTGLSGAQFGLNQQGMIGDQADRYRADLLNLGSLGGQLAGQAGSQQLAAAGMFPGVYELGRTPGSDLLEYANYDRALREDALGADMDRFNYMRDQPYDNLGWFQNMISGISSPYSVQSQQNGGSKTAGALGGAVAGAQMGSSIMPGWGTAIGAVLGGLGGYFI